MFRRETKIFGIALGAALTAGAWTQEVSVWKGETMVVRWMDACTLGTNVVSGVSLRSGTLKDVRFLEDPRGIVYRTAADRVAWDIDEVGPHILEIAVAPEARSGTYRIGAYPAFSGMDGFLRWSRNKGLVFISFTYCFRAAEKGVL